jgi:hypothetical protein
MMKSFTFCFVLSLAVLVTSSICSESSSKLDGEWSNRDHDFAEHELFMGPEDNAQEAFSAGGIKTPSVKVQGTTPPAPQGCGYYKKGHKYSYEHHLDINLAEYMDVEDEDTDSTENTVGFDVLLSIEPMSTRVKQGVTSVLFRMDVIEAVLQNENLPREKMAKLLQLMDGYALLGGCHLGPGGCGSDTHDEELDNLELSRKFMRNFYYRMDCNGRMLEVHNSVDESFALVEAKEKMATSFFHATLATEAGVEADEEGQDLDETEQQFQNMAADYLATESASQSTQASSANEQNTHMDVEEDGEEGQELPNEKEAEYHFLGDDLDETTDDLDETEAQFQDMAANFFATQSASETADASSANKETDDAHEAVTDNEEDHFNAEEAPLEGRSADEDIEVTAKQPKLPDGKHPEFSKCQKSSDGLLAEGKLKRKSSSLGIKECAAPPIGIKVNQTCSISRIAQPRS